MVRSLVSLVSVLTTAAGKVDRLRLHTRPSPSPIEGLSHDRVTPPACDRYHAAT